MEPLITRIRPTKFSEIIGCNTNKKSFLSLIKKNDCGTFLLSGERGLGKTSFSKLMGKKICRKYKSPNESIIEINVSDKNGVDNARAIIEECKIGSFFNSTVYILNEFHEATKNFQDAILDLFEHPPENTFFILCTTQPEKLDKAVLSRCTRYLFNPLTKNDFIELIEATRKEIDVNENLIDKIYSASFGIPREALSIIESISPLNEKESIEFIDNYSIDLSENSDIKELNKELMKMKSLDLALEILKRINAKPEDIRNSILNYFFAVMIKPFRNKEETRLKAALCIESFKENVFYSGKAGLALAIFNYYSD